MTGYMIVNTACYPECMSSTYIYTSLEALHAAVNDGVKDLNELHQGILVHSVIDRSDSGFTTITKWVKDGSFRDDGTVYDIIELTINPPFEP